MNVDLEKYMFFIGFQHTDTNGGFKTFIYDDSNINARIFYGKSEEEGDGCLIRYSLKKDKSTETSHTFSEKIIIDKLAKLFENSLERYQLYESRRLKVKKLLES